MIVDESSHDGTIDCIPGTLDGMVGQAVYYSAAVVSSRYEYPCHGWVDASSPAHARSN